MKKTEALSVINCNNDCTIEDIEDSFELSIFALKKKFIERFPPIKIMLSTIERLKRLKKVKNTLQISIPISTIKFISLKFKDISLNKFLKQYQIEANSIKLNIANVYEPTLFIEQIKLLIKLHQILFFKLVDIAQYAPKDDELTPIKLSEQIDIYKLNKELLILNKEDNKLSEYISNVKTSYFYTCVLIAHKQIKYNGLRREI